jgi:galactonate dehydratase
VSDIRITDVETHAVANPWKPWVFVRVETNREFTGLGEATLPRNVKTVMAAIDEETKHYVGEDPFETEKLFLKLYRDRGGMMPHIVKMAVISAMDTACWDIKGKALNRPLYELLGGSVHGDRLRAYANGWYTESDGTPESFAEAAERVVADGYDALKFDPFGAAWERLTRKELNHAVDIVRAVREAVGPDVDLMIEGHYRFTPGVAVEIADKIAEFDPTWFEQPTPPDNLSGLRKVASRSSIPIAVDRSPEAGVDVDLLETGVDILQPDLLYNGGVTKGKKIAAMAEAEHLSFAPHNAQGPVSTALCAHVDASVPNFMIQEVFEDYAHPDWGSKLLEESLTIEEGYIHLPDGPGLGIELDLGAVREHEYDENSDDVEIMNLFEQGWESRSFGEN